ncbi:MAG: hypothetical protein HY720_00840 [Planctomycetes bacterium]|nr:hypothetical protein [Planctomycetota bacterium]
MFGGHDIHVPMTPSPGPDDLDFVLRMIRHVWPDALVEDLAKDGVDHLPIDDVFPIGPSREVLIYRDTQSLCAWREHGATPGNESTLVHVLLGDQGLTIVVDARDSATGKLIEQIIEALLYNRLPAGSCRTNAA